MCFITEGLQQQQKAFYLFIFVINISVGRGPTEITVHIFLCRMSFWILWPPAVPQCLSHSLCLLFPRLSYWQSKRLQENLTSKKLETSSHTVCIEDCLLVCRAGVWNYLCGNMIPQSGTKISKYNPYLHIIKEAKVHHHKHVRVRLLPKRTGIVSVSGFT